MSAPPPPLSSPASKLRSAATRGDNGRSSRPTGKPYYWHVATRETRWTKPASAANEDARRRAFFAGMERNILRRLAQGGDGPGGDGGDGGDAERVSPTRSGIEEGSLRATEASAAAASPGGASACRDDWVAGWITPGSAGGDTASLTGDVSAPSDDGSRGSPGDGGGLLLRGGAGGPPAAAGSKLDRLKSAAGGRPVIDKLALIRTISTMEAELARQLDDVPGRSKCPHRRVLPRPPACRAASPTPPAACPHLPWRSPANARRGGAHGGAVVIVGVQRQDCQLPL